MTSTTEDQPEERGESIVEQEERAYGNHVANTVACVELAGDAGNDDVARGYLAAGQINATLAHAAATRLQAEHLERLATAVVSAAEAITTQLVPALGPLLAALQDLAGRLNAPPVVSAEDRDAEWRKAGGPVRLHRDAPPVVSTERPAAPPAGRYHGTNGPPMPGEENFEAPQAASEPRRSPEAATTTTEPVSAVSGGHSGPGGLDLSYPGWVGSLNPVDGDPDGPSAGGWR